MKAVTTILMLVLTSSAFPAARVTVDPSFSGTGNTTFNGIGSFRALFTDDFDLISAEVRLLAGTPPTQLQNDPALFFYFPDYDEITFSTWGGWLPHSVTPAACMMNCAKAIGGFIGPSGTETKTEQRCKWLSEAPANCIEY